MEYDHEQNKRSACDRNLRVSTIEIRESVRLDHVEDEDRKVQLSESGDDHDDPRNTLE